MEDPGAQCAAGREIGDICDRRRSIEVMQLIEDYYLVIWEVMHASK